MVIVSMLDTGNEIQLSGNFGYAGFWRRMAAGWADLTAMFAINWVIVTLLLWVVDLTQATWYTLTVHKAVVNGLNMGVLIGYFSLQEVPGGQTWGRRLMGIRLVCETTLTTQISMNRQFNKVLSALLLGAGYWMMLSNPQKQTWHDKRVKTWVVVDPNAPAGWLTGLINIAGFLLAGLFLVVLIHEIETVINSSAAF
jgi:uncharacterized RDD family membrane protein YckC